MDETRTNGTEVEAQDDFAIIPEGWDGVGDFFDEASWTDEPETSEESTPVAEDSVPEVDPTTVEEGTENVEQEAPTTETEPVADTSRKFKFTAKVDHNDLDVELDEADLPDMYQKAQVVDRVQAQMGKMKGTVDRATKLAKGMGFEDADAMLIAAAKNHLQNEIDRLVNDKEHPVHPDVARDIMERRLGYTMEDLDSVQSAAVEAPPESTPPAQTQAPAQGRDFQSEVEELLAEYPELVGKELPAEVAQTAVTSGERLLDVYKKYERNSQAQQVQSLVRENKVLKQNAETAKRAPVTGVTGHGIEGNEPTDPFLVGFEEGARW